MPCPLLPHDAPARRVEDVEVPSVGIEVEPAVRDRGRVLDRARGVEPPDLPVRGSMLEGCEVGPLQITAIGRPRLFSARSALASLLGRELDRGRTANLAEPGLVPCPRAEHGSTDQRKKREDDEQRPSARHPAAKKRSEHEHCCSQGEQEDNCGFDGVLEGQRLPA